jgi:serine/threonine protein kinase
VDRVMGEGAFSLVWSAREMVRSTRRSKSRSTLLVPQSSTSRSGRVGQEDTDDEEEYEPKGDEVVAIKMMDKRMCKENDRTRISFVREVAVLRVSTDVIVLH